jgi:PAS domain S-box-containing protein
LRLANNCSCILAATPHTITDARNVQDGNLTNEELGLALERLALALSATGLGVWERDLTTNRVTWSDSMYQLFGRKPEEFSGDPDGVLSFVHSDDRTDFRQGYLKALQDERDFFEQEFRIIRPNGEVRWVQRRGPDGRAQSVLGVALDITERKHAEEANARLASLVSGADDAIIGMRLDSTIVSWNPAAERLFGYRDEEMIGRSLRILYPEGAEAEFETLYARVRAGEHLRYEGVRRRRDGTPVHVSVVVTPVLGKNGAPVGASAIVRDETERKRTEQQLVDALALLMQTSNQRKMALAAGGMGIFEVDVGRDRIIWSDEIYAQVGIERTSETLPMAAIERFVHPDDLALARTNSAAAFAAGGIYENEFRVIRADGQVRWLYVRAQASASGDRPAKIYGISMDITERKEREAHIRFLLSEVAHRSKNLLAVVQAIAAQTARATSSPLSFADDFGDRLKSLAASLDLLVQQEWLGVSVEGLVQSQLGHYAEPGNTRVRFEGPSVMLSPLAAQYLGMALHELSTNAAKYGALSGAVGTVAIAWRVAGQAGNRRFQMSWREDGGPAVAPPTKTGFGSLVIERMAAEALHGQVTLEYAREGVRWSLDADADATLKNAPLKPAPGSASRATMDARTKGGPVQGEKTRGD